MVFNYAIAMAITPPTIEVSVEDLNGDGLKDVRFTALKEGLGFAGVNINITIGISSRLTLSAGKTDSLGSCIFLDFPSGTYGWTSSEGAPNEGEITVPIPELCLTESEFVAWQTIAMNWMGDSASSIPMFENMARFVGLDVAHNPLPVLIGSRLIDYARNTYQWLEKLQLRISALNHPELSLLNKMIFPFKAVSLGFFEDTANGIDFSKILGVRMQLVLNASESSMIYSFANLYSGERTASYHEIAKFLGSPGLEKTAWAALQPVLGALGHFNKPSFIDPSATWDCSLTSSDGSLASTLIGALDMSESILSRTCVCLERARSVLGALARISDIPAQLLNTISTLISAVTVAYGVIITVMFVLHWWEKYQTPSSFLFHLFQGDPVLLVEIGMVAFNVAVCLFYALIAPTLAIPGIGIVFAVVEAVLWFLYERANYADWINDIEEQASKDVTNLLRIRQSLSDINTYSLKESARTYGKAAHLLAQFASIAHQHSAASGMDESLAESSAGISTYAEQDLELANAVGNASQSLDYLLENYLSWNGSNGQVRAHLEFYNSTSVTFHFDDGTTRYGFLDNPVRYNMWKQETLIEWCDQIAQATNEFRADLRQVQYALNAPVYEQNATSKPQFGNSWSNVSDSSSTSGQIMKASALSPNEGCLYGPYIKSTSSDESMLDMPYYVSFRLKVSPNVSSGVVAIIDVAYNEGAGVLQSRQIRANDFSAPNSWQDFKLSFITPSSLTAGLEFRVVNLNNGVTDLYVDRIVVYRGWNASTVYVEAAYNKRKVAYPPPVSWSRLSDSSSSSGIVLKAPASSASGSWLYGPYINETWDGENMRGKPYVASFRLMVSPNALASNVVYIDVNSNYYGGVLQSKVIRANDFAAPNVWQDFSLTFIVPDISAAGLEFRVMNLNNGVTDLYVDRIAVYRGWNSSTVYVEAAYNKPKTAYGTPVSWSRLTDSSSYSGIVFKASASNASGSWLYGPYIVSDLAGRPLSGKPYVAIFRLKISSNFSPAAVAYVDVGYNEGMTLQSMQIKANDFAHPDRWQDFKLSFIAPSSFRAGLEFRVENVNNNVTDLFVDTITVCQGWSVSDVYVEAAYNKLQGGDWQPWPLYYNSSWARVLDPSSSSGLVMRAASSSARSDWLYGPYMDEQSMRGKLYTATFRLKVSSNTSPTGVFYVDVGYNAGVVLQSSLIKSSDFVSANVWQDFNLTFIVPLSLTYGLEFRIVNINQGVADVYVDRITVGEGWNLVTTYLESAYDKPQSGSSWTDIIDASSFSGKAIMASISSPNDGRLYGPYMSVGWDEESMLGRNFTAIFRLKVSSNSAASDVVSIDVAYNAGTVLQSLKIKATDFTSSNTWQDFPLTFTVPTSLTYGLEFRVININHGTTDIFADCISINQA
jgi:hypothetical protein